MNAQMTIYIEVSRFGYVRGLTDPIEWLVDYLNSGEMSMDIDLYRKEAKEVIDAFIAFFQETAVGGPILMQ